MQDEKDAYDESEVDPNDTTLGFENESHAVLEEDARVGSFQDEELLGSVMQSSGTEGEPSSMAYPLAFTTMNVKM